MNEININDVKEVIGEICEDSSTPKNVRLRIDAVLGILNENNEISIKINKALQALDEIVHDNNMQQFTRTQIWNASSLLEKV